MSNNETLEDRINEVAEVILDTDEEESKGD